MEISKLVKCSRCNALKHVKQFVCTTENVKEQPSARKITPGEHILIYKVAANNHCTS